MKAVQRDPEYYGVWRKECIEQMSFKHGLRY